MTLHLGDCLEVLKTLSDNLIDSIVTDPPYGLSFMGKKWDYDVPSKEIWIEALRVLKPGGHLLAFGGTRTYHRLVVNIEDAGFEIRDQIQWNFGSGFPKSCDIKRSGIKQGIICECEGNYKLLDLWQRGGKMEMLAQENQDTNVQSSMQRSSSGPRMENSRAQGPSSLDEIKSRVISEENDRLEQSCVEGRDNFQAKQRELHRPEICPVSSGVYSDGSQGRLCNGAQIDNGETHKENIDSNGSSSSQRSQHKKQSYKKLGTLANKSESQESGVWPRCPECLKHVVPEGWGTALKPANEPICVARKPLEKGLTVAQNVLKWSTGAINIDECRIEFKSDADKEYAKPQGDMSGVQIYKGQSQSESKTINAGFEQNQKGRWPANIILDEESAALLDLQSGDSKSTKRKSGQDYSKVSANINVGGGNKNHEYTDSGGASRFFYVAKASKSERNRGLEGLPLKTYKTGCGGAMPIDDDGNDRDRFQAQAQNYHPTIKPLKLMEYLIKLVTPKNGTTLDPFMGSGSTGVAAKNLGFKFVGIEMNPEYFEIAKKRINADEPKKKTTKIKQMTFYDLAK